MSSCSHPLRAEWLCLTFDPSKHYQSYLITVDTFSGYRIAVPVQSASSSHTTVAIETNLCQVFGFMDHLQSDNCVPFIAKTTQRWADSQNM